MPLFRRYAFGARAYDVLSGEYLVYRVGRVAGIDALQLSLGDTVVDLGCGTGLNFQRLMDRIGPTGLIVGVDRSMDMLRMARRRALRRGWDNVRLISADATTLSASRLAEAVTSDHGGDGIRTVAPTPPTPTGDSAASAHGRPQEPDAATSPTTDSAASAHGGPRVFDAAIATYALSVFDDWHPAWNLLRAVLRPSGRIAVVDMARPTGLGSLLGPLALAACAAGGADIDAVPWRALEQAGVDVSHATFRSGHIHVVVGALP